MLKVLDMPHDTQIWTHYDKRAKTYRTTSSSGPSCENVMARIAIDDKTGHITSQDHTKHMNEKDVYQNLTSGRDIRTLLHHCSTMTRISN